MYKNSTNRRGKNNPMWGLHLSDEAKARIGAANSGARNGQWQGDSVGYDALHEWVGKRIAKPCFCQRCGTGKVIDLANKNDDYRRELSGWWWLCRRCHMRLDGRLETLHRPRTGWFQSCRYCGKKFWIIPCRWNRGQGRYCSKHCSNKGR